MMETGDVRTVATHHSGFVRESLCYVRIWKLHRTLFGNALTLFFPGTHIKYQAHKATHIVTDLLTAPWRFTRCAPVLHLHFACARIPMTSMCLGRILKVKHAVLARRIYITSVYSTASAEEGEAHNSINVEEKLCFSS